MGRVETSEGVGHAIGDSIAIAGDGLCSLLTALVIDLTDDSGGAGCGLVLSQGQVPVRGIVHLSAFEEDHPTEATAVSHGVLLLLHRLSHLLPILLRRIDPVLGER